MVDEGNGNSNNGKSWPAVELPTAPVLMEEHIAAQRAYIAAMKEYAVKINRTSKGRMLAAQARVMEIDLHNALYNRRLMEEARAMQRSGIVVPGMGPAPAGPPGRTF